MSGLEWVRLVLLVVHLVAMAAVVGPALLQRRGSGPVGLPTMLAGALAAVVSGAALAAVRTVGDLPLIGPRIAVKAGLALVVLAVLVVAAIRDRRGGGGVVLPRAAGVVAALAVGVAVLWV